MKALKLPEYALGVDPSYLIQITCRGSCKKPRWAKTDAAYPGRDQLKSGEGPAVATCLKCGFEATDYYNWGRSDLDY